MFYFVSVGLKSHSKTLDDLKASKSPFIETHEQIITKVQSCRDKKAWITNTSSLGTLCFLFTVLSDAPQNTRFIRNYSNISENRLLQESQLTQLLVEWNNYSDLDWLLQMLGSPFICMITLRDWYNVFLFLGTSFHYFFMLKIKS